MISLEKIKLIVWDLDDTLWSGTISEGGVTPILNNIHLVKDLTDCGIINSICSKNDLEVAKKELEKEGVWEYFVFCSINWDNKAMRLKSMIETMALRPANVLFIDDNSFNLNEAKHVLPDLMVASPEEIPSLIKQVNGLNKKDLSHKRLNQYKVLEEKALASMKYESNEDFLFSTNIRVDMHEDCLPELSRIHELLLRSNQLNYTKKRIPINELESIIKNPSYRCGYVCVKDNYGDYGLVGFYAVKDNVLEHFFFSCRTMGQLIEQYVYAQLGFPSLEVVGDVRTELNDHTTPKWINQNCYKHNLKKADVDEINLKILVKGPCDLSKACMYLQQSPDIEMELTHMRDNGQDIYYHNHSAFISQLFDLNDDNLSKLLGKWKFLEPESYGENIFDKEYDIIFLSTLLESRVGIYRRKTDGLVVTYGHYDVPLTDPANWEFYTTTSDDGYIFELDELKEFADDFECVGRTTPEAYISFLEKMMQVLPQKTILALTLGATKYWPTNDNISEHHKLLNAAIEDYAKNHDRIQIISIDNCLESEKGYAADVHIDHFNAKVYYNMASRMTEILSSCSGNKVQYNLKSKNYVIIDNYINHVKKYFKGPIYKYLRNAYLYITGRQHQ